MMGYAQVMMGYVEVMKIHHLMMSTFACVESGKKLSLFQPRKIPRNYDRFDQI